MGQPDLHNIEHHAKSLKRFLVIVGKGDATAEDVCLANIAINSIMSELDLLKEAADYDRSHDEGPSLCELCDDILGKGSMFHERQAS